MRSVMKLREAWLDMLYLRCVLLLAYRSFLLIFQRFVDGPRIEPFADFMALIAGVPALTAAAAMAFPL